MPPPLKNFAVLILAYPSAAGLENRKKWTTMLAPPIYPRVVAARLVSRGAPAKLALYVVIAGSTE